HASAVAGPLRRSGRMCFAVTSSRGAAAFTRWRVARITATDGTWALPPFPGIHRSRQALERAVPGGAIARALGGLEALHDQLAVDRLLVCDPRARLRVVALALVHGPDALLDFQTLRVSGTCRLEFPRRRGASVLMLERRVLALRPQHPATTRAACARRRQRGTHAEQERGHETSLRVRAFVLPPHCGDPQSFRSAEEVHPLRYGDADDLGAERRGRFAYVAAACAAGRRLAGDGADRRDSALG